MKKLLISTALAASFIAPASVSAQAVPAATIAVVDLDRVTRDCNACKTASATLRSQATAAQAREKVLGDQIQAEGKTLQTQADALKGAQPDAALQARIKAFQTKQQNAVEELQRAQAGLERNQAYIRQQIAQKLGPIYSQVMQRRGANIMLEVGSTLATASSIDVSTDILTALNAALPSLSSTAPAAAVQKTPQGR